MRAEAMPIIRLEIENLKSSVCHYLGIEGSELEQVIKQEIEKQSRSLIKQIEKEVANSVSSLINERVRLYFLAGEGKNKIYEAIEKSFRPNKNDKQ